MTSILKVSEIQDPTNSNTALTIDSSGRPLIANGKVPCFHVYRSTNQTITTATVTDVVYNANHFLHDWTLNTSTGVLTAGSNAGGIYMLHTGGRINTASDGEAHIKLLLNSTSIQAAYQNNEYYDFMTISMLYEITAGDTLKTQIYHNTGTDRTVGNIDNGYHLHFFGHRISAQVKNMATVSDAISALNSDLQWVLRGEPTDAYEFNTMFAVIIGEDENGTAIESKEDDDWQGITWNAVEDKLAELNAAEPLKSLREERNRRIAETDWWASSDLTMSAERTAYRQALRDITDSYTSLDDVVWPDKPE